MAGDLRTLRLVAGRLEARLAGGALTAIGMDAAVLAKESLVALVPVLDALRRTITIIGAPTTASPEKDAAA
jgi:hypothetical protein